MQKKSWFSDCSVPNLESCEVDGKSSIDIVGVCISPLNIIKPARRIHSIHIWLQLPLILYLTFMKCRQ